MNVVVERTVEIVGVISSPTVVRVDMGNVGPQGEEGPQGNAGTSTAPSYTKAAMLALPSPSAGDLVRLSDDIRGLWIYNGIQWKSITGWADVTDFGAVGAGGDDTAAIQAAEAACPVGAMVYLPATEGVGINQTVYGVTAPIELAAGKSLVGSGLGTPAQGVTIKALAGFTGYAVIENDHWTLGIEELWWNGGAIENLVIDCDGEADHGVAIYQMGEESVCRRVSVWNAVDDGWVLAGVHAPATLEYCSSWECGGYGLSMTTHPTLYPTAAAGNVRLIGFSGDLSVAGHVWIGGTHQVSIIGIKSERHTQGIVIGADGEDRIGGLAAQVFLTGSFNAGNVNGLDVVKIVGNAQPIVVIGPTNSTGVGAGDYENYINDTYASKTLAKADMGDAIGMIFWNGVVVSGATEFMLDREKALRLRHPTTSAIIDVLKWSSNEQVEIRGGEATEGVVIRDTLSNALMQFRAAANGGIAAYVRFSPEVGIMFPIDVWNIDTNGNNRLHFAGGGRTYLDAGTTSGPILSVRGPGNVEFVEVNGTIADGETAFLVRVDRAGVESVVRVKEGASGTGPGGVGRALYTT